MREYLKLAYRNLIRYRKRTILTGLGMLIGGFILTLNQAFSAGVERQLIMNMIASDTGHIRITGRKEHHEKGFEEAYNKEQPLIRNPGPIERALIKEPFVKGFSKQVVFMGMISNGLKLRPGTIVGIEPEKEKDLLERVIPPIEGTAFDKADSQGIYINTAAAKAYQIGVGETLTIMVQTREGGSNALDFTIKGIYRESNTRAGAGTLYILLKSAQELAQLDGAVNQIKVFLDNPDLAAQKAKYLSKTLTKQFPIDITDWKTAGKFFLGTVLATKIFGDILCLVLFIVIIASIINTMLMAVYSRTREIGTMMAMGTKRRQVLGIFVTEALFLGAVATGVGVFFGSLVSLWLGKVGIPAFTESLRYAFGGDRVFPYLTLSNILSSLLIIVLLTVAASIYPAWMAARLKPVEALQHI